VEARLQQIEHEGDAPAYDVVLKRVDALMIAGARQTVPHVSHMSELRYPTLARLYEWLSQAGAREPATELMIYHNEEYSDENIHMEAAVALSKADVKRVAGWPEVDVSLRELPACDEVASTIHNSNLFDIPNAIVAVFTWMGRHGYRSAGPIRELHLQWRELEITDMDMARGATRILEIQVPVVCD
jgi:effector-binding domain-containing protein